MGVSFWHFGVPIVRIVVQYIGESSLGVSLFMQTVRYSLHTVQMYMSLSIVLFLLVLHN